MKHRYAFSFFLLLVSLSFVFSLTPNPGHDANEILIEVGEYTMTLQEALTNDFLMNPSKSPTRDYTTSSPFSHSGSEIQIYIEGRMSLQDAMDDRTSFCGDAPGTFSWLFSFGHGADKVVFDDDETLQDKIENVGPCPVDCVGSWNKVVGTCSAACDGGAGGNYDKQWTTTVESVGSGTPCPSPTFEEIGGNACNTPSCGYWDYYWTASSNTNCMGDSNLAAVCSPDLPAPYWEVPETTNCIKTTHTKCNLREPITGKCLLKKYSYTYSGACKRWVVT